MLYKKYYLYKEQISYDSGTTWQDTGNQAPSGSPIDTYETYEECVGTACTCDAFAFEGTSEGNNTYRIDIGSGETAVTAATWNTDCGLAPQDFVHTDDSGFQVIVTDGHWSFDNNIIRFTASTNPTNVVREGNMTITYTVDGVSCTKVTHLVQAAGTGTTPTEVLINFIVDNDTSSSKYLGSFEIHTNGGSALFTIDETIAANTTKTYPIDIGAGVEGNTVTQVDGVVDNLDWCYTFICPAHGCDLTAGDSLSIKLSTQTSCS